MKLCRTALVAAAASGPLAGCTTSAPSTAYTPITGIEIPSADLVAGHGCGNGTEGQVYKYAAVVAYDDPGTDEDGGGTRPSAVSSAVFDCFADGVFSNLPQSDAGNLSFAIAIYAYNRCSFPTELACSPNATAACPAEDANVVAQSLASQPSNWTTTCSATQVPGVTVIADCLPLEPENAAPPCGDASTE